MLIRSFVREAQRLIPIEVELTLWPGLPIIQFLGLADQQIKESALRIKSAIKAQGFEFPRSQQILVNLRPSHFKKTSQGLELAVALAYLLESEQISFYTAEDFSKLYVYGSLGLNGEVQAPDDLALVRGLESALLLTGAGAVPNPVEGVFQIARLPALSDLRNPLQFTSAAKVKQWRRPPLSSDLLWSEQEAELLAVAAAGEHALLLAGPAGSGKTSMAKFIHQILPVPNISLSCHEDSDWRPLVQPHHSTPLRAMIGGGSDLSFGEISRAHHGILLLDEFLEFESKVIEALREPLEEGVIRLARGSRKVELPAHFQLLATSNLCPCGSWSPGKVRTSCRFTLQRCKSYGQRFSGPLLDRFHLLHFTVAAKVNNQTARKISAVEVLEKVENATENRILRGQLDSNTYVPIIELERLEQKILKAELFPEQMGSRRRRNATLRVARTLADLDAASQIQIPHLQKALQWTYVNFNQISQWDRG
jgi:magnesium chelatase family protein